MSDTIPVKLTLRKDVAALERLKRAAVQFAEALLSEQPKAGWDELQEMEQAAIEFYRSRSKK